LGLRAAIWAAADSNPKDVVMLNLCGETSTETLGEVDVLGNHF
jgi:hypothetical protein